MKKYVPSGYQILNLEIDTYSNLVLNEDSAILKEYLSSDKCYEKMLFVHLIDNANGYKISSVATIRDNMLFISQILGTESVSYEIKSDLTVTIEDL